FNPQDGLPSNAHIDAQVILAAPLAANLVNFHPTAIFVSMEDMSGIQLNFPDFFTVGTALEFSTDQNGNITQWLVELIQQIPLCPGSVDTTVMKTQNQGGTISDSTDFTRVLPPTFQPVTIYHGENSNMPGAWFGPVKVPEPSTPTLLGIALAGVLGAS